MKVRKMTLRERGTDGKREIHELENLRYYFYDAPIPSVRTDQIHWHRIYGIYNSILLL